METTRERVVKLCREKCPPRSRCKGAGSMCVKVLLVLVNFSFLVSGLAVLGLGVWLHVNGDSLFYTHLVRASPHAVSSSATIVSSSSSSSSVAVQSSSSSSSSPVASSSASSTTSSLLTNDVISVDSWPFFMMAAGSCVTLVGFLGCCGACTESVCFLSFYSVLTVLIVVAELAGIAVSAGVRQDWSERLLVNLQHQVQYDYNFTAQKTNNTSYAYGLTLAWNSIQTYLNCCGATGPQDYLYSSWFNHTRDFTGVFVPPTCCRLLAPLDPVKPLVKDENLCQVEAIVHRATAQPITQLHTQGCHEALIEWIERHEHIAVIQQSVIIMLQIVNVVFACLLMNAIRKKHTDYTWCDVDDFE